MTRQLSRSDWPDLDVLRDGLDSNHRKAARIIQAALCAGRRAAITLIDRDERVEGLETLAARSAASGPSRGSLTLATKTRRKRKTRRTFVFQ